MQFAAVIVLAADRAGGGIDEAPLAPLEVVLVQRAAAVGVAELAQAARVVVLRGRHLVALAIDDRRQVMGDAGLVAVLGAAPELVHHRHEIARSVVLVLDLGAGGIPDGLDPSEGVALDRDALAAGVEDGVVAELYDVSIGIDDLLDAVLGAE